MLSAASPPFPFLSPKPSPWREVQVLYRRICVLGATGKREEADTLRTQQLEPAIKALRESSAVADDQLEAMFAAEEERAATAHMLAEILLPLLSEATTAAAPLRRNFPSQSSPSHEYASSAESVSQPGFEPATGNSASPLLPGIADFIDEMLTQDRSPSGARSPRRSP